MQRSHGTTRVRSGTGMVGRVDHHSFLDASVMPMSRGDASKKGQMAGPEQEEEAEVGEAEVGVAIKMDQISAASATITISHGYP